jgi:AraC-like DNA-binding protein
LSEHFASELRLDVLARKSAVSKCHLVHLFHKEMGLPPHAYQIQLRVVHARRLIVEGLPLGEVAALTGFSDQSHLTRQFKRIVGVPPGQFIASRTHRAVRPAPPEPVEEPYPATAEPAHAQGS